MADGKEEPIAGVKVGDKVLATDPETGRTETRPVTALIQHSGKHTMVDILTNPGTFEGTMGGGNLAGGHVFISKRNRSRFRARRGVPVLRKDGLSLSIHVGIAYPPHRDDGVAKFHVAHDAIVDIPAEIFRDGGRLMLGLYSRTDGLAWEYPLSDFLAAIAPGIGVLEAG